MTIHSINPDLSQMFYDKGKGLFETLDYDILSNTWHRVIDQPSGNSRVKILSNRGALKWYQKHKNQVDIEILPF